MTHEEKAVDFFKRLLSKRIPAWVSCSLHVSGFEPDSSVVRVRPRPDLDVFFRFYCHLDHDDMMAEYRGEFGDENRVIITDIPVEDLVAMVERRLA